MYTVRDYIVSFCNPSLGLKASWVASGGAAFSDLCVDAKGNTIAGGPDAFPSSDLNAVLSSKGFKLYEETIVVRERLQNGMAYDEFRRGMMTNKRVSGGSLQFAFLGINSTVPTGDFPYSEQKDLFEHYENYFDKRLVVNNKAYFSSFIFNWMFITEALVSNTIQSLILALIFCWIITTTMTWNVLLGIFGVGSVLMTVCMSVAFICLMGWTLGIIEAIVLIVIVGISVDYAVHIVHAYNHAYEAPDKTPAEVREAKSHTAVGSMGISLLSGMATSVGAAIFLWFCQVSFFRKFGQFLMITLILSLIVTLFFLIPLLIGLGPRHHSAGWLFQKLGCQSKSDTKVEPSGDDKP